MHVLELHKYLLWVTLVAHVFFQRILVKDVEVHLLRNVRL